MNAAGKTIAYILAAILVVISCFCLFISFMFIYGSGAPNASPGQLGQGIVGMTGGLVLLAGGLGLGVYMYLRSKKAEQAAQNVTLKVDLPANVNVEQMKCRSCGGALTMENITMVAGAPVVSCPYCKTTYQLTEEPKW